MASDAKLFWKIMAVVVFGPSHYQPNGCDVASLAWPDLNNKSQSVIVVLGALSHHLKCEMKTPPLSRF